MAIKPIIIAKISAKNIIKTLVSCMLCLWLLAYLYFMSNKSFGPVFNYDTAFLDRKCLLQDQISKNKFSSNAALKLAYMQLTQISLCENDFESAQTFIDSLNRISSDDKDNLSRLNLDFFIANIYRDFGRLDQAQKNYSQTLSQSRFDLPQYQISKARVLNNIGTTCFLQAKAILDKNESQKEYLIGRQYFQKALSLAGTADLNLRKTIQNNLHQCSSELKFLD